MRRSPLSPQAATDVLADAGAPVDAGTDTSVPAAAALGGDPAAYEFLQAMRLLHRWFHDREPVGGFGDPSREVVRLGVDPSLAFPPGYIAALTDTPDGPPRLSVNFMGLIGPSGVLPHRYTMLAAERARARDHALRDFLDIFHHRLLSLFHLALEKHRFALAHERAQRDLLGRHLLDLIGLGAESVAARLGVPADSLMRYAGLLALHPRPAVALEALVADYFGVPAVVEQFVGGWHALETDALCRLGDEEPAATLGGGAVAGDEIWDQQACARLRLGPLSRAQYDDFLPTGRSYAALCTLVRFFTGDEVEVELQLALRREDVPPCTLETVDGAAASPQLGWCTWLRASRAARDPDDTLLSLAEAGTGS